MSARARRTRPLARRRQILICSYYTDHGPYCDKLGRLDEFDYRVGLEWKPTSFYHATFKLESIQRETGGYAYQPVPLVGRTARSLAATCPRARPGMIFNVNPFDGTQQARGGIIGGDQRMRLSSKSNVRPGASPIADLMTSNTALRDRRHI